MQWYQKVAHQYLDGIVIDVKEFHEQFLAPAVAPADHPALNDVFTLCWQRHAVSWSTGTMARVQSRLQVANSQVLTPAIQAQQEVWAQSEVE